MKRQRISLERTRSLFKAKRTRACTSLASIPDVSSNYREVRRKEGCQRGYLRGSWGVCREGVWDWAVGVGGGVGFGAQLGKHLVDSC